jgi:hypothetical protein
MTSRQLAARRAGFQSEKVATLERKRGPLTIETFQIDVVADPKGVCSRRCRRN